MNLGTCGDPNCPNLARSKDLERERDSLLEKIAFLRKILHDPKPTTPPSLETPYLKKDKTV